MPNVGSVWDGFLDEDIDYTADSNKLFVRWKDFTDNQSIDFYEAAIGSNNDTINIASWQKSTSVDNIQILGLNLERGVKYFSYLRAVDSAANISSILKSDGLEFDNTPPNIKSIYPLFGPHPFPRCNDLENIFFLSFHIFRRQLGFCAKILILCF